MMETTQHASWRHYGVLAVLAASLSLPVSGDWRHYGSLDLLPDVVVAGSIVTPTLAMFVAQDRRNGDLSLLITLPAKAGTTDTTRLVFTLPKRKPYVAKFHVLRQTNTHTILKTNDIGLIEMLSGLQGSYPYVDVSSKGVGTHRFDLAGITTALLELAAASRK